MLKIICFFEEISTYSKHRNEMTQIVQTKLSRPSGMKWSEAPQRQVLKVVWSAVGAAQWGRVL